MYLTAGNFGMYKFRINDHKAFRKYFAFRCLHIVTPPSFTLVCRVTGFQMLLQRFNT